MCDTIFVFGSNLAGRHGKGAAAHASKHYGAAYGVGSGRTGCSYAIPTKDENLKTLPLEEIREEVIAFLEYAKDNTELVFLVTKIGCGLAGYAEKDIKPMFAKATDNCRLPKGW